MQAAFEHSKAHNGGSIMLLEGLGRCQDLWKEEQINVQRQEILLKSAWDLSTLGQLNILGQICEFGTALSGPARACTRVEHIWKELRMCFSNHHPT